MSRSISILSFFLLAISANAAHVVFNYQSLNTAPQGLRTVTLFPTGTFTNGNGGIITRDRVRGTTDTTGSVTISNVYGGTYRGELVGNADTTTNWYGFPVTNGLINAADYTTNIPGISVPFTLTAADARYFQIAGLNLQSSAGLTVSVVTNPVFTTMTVSNPVSAANGGNTATLSISGNQAQGGFGDSFQSTPSTFSLNLGGSGRFFVVPSEVVQGTAAVTGGLTTSDISETNGAGTTTIHDVASTGTMTASNFVTSTTSAGVGQFTGNGGGLSNLPAASISGTLTGSAGSLTNVLRGYITPFDVGAVGDGSTDDTAALRKWIFIACSSNWIAFLPPAPGGFYKITDVLQITNGMNNVTIQGTGGPIFDGASLRSASQIKQFGAGKDGIVITNVVSGIKMRDFLITHNTYSYATRGIAFDGNNGDSDCSFIEGVGIQGFGRGLSLSSVADFQAKGCAFQLNGDGVFVGAGTYTQSGVVENNLLFASCQISYNRTNNMFATAGTITLLLDDIAQADDGTSQMLSSVGLRVTNAFVTAVSCNFENDIAAGSAQPCIIAGGSSGGGQLTLRGGGSQGQGGANGYTLKATNINVYIDANFNAGAVASDTYGIYEDVSANGGSLIRSAVLTPFKANLNSTVYDGRTSLFMREWWGGHSALSKTETLWQDHSGWIDSNGVSQGGFDDLNSFLIGARMYGYQGGDNGVKEVDLLQYAKDKVSQMPIYNLYASNAVLIASNSMANVGTRIGNMIKGDILLASSNGVPWIVSSDPAGNKRTNYVGFKSIISSAANYNVLITDDIVLLNGNLTATLPTAVGIAGKEFEIMCKTAGTNGILSTSAQTFLGYGSTAATKWTNSVVGRSSRFVSDGANWVVTKSDN